MFKFPNAARRNPVYNYGLQDRGQDEDYGNNNQHMLVSNTVAWNRQHTLKR